MANSSQRLINGVNDRYLALTGDGFVRKLGLPAGWQNIVIGLQCGFADTGGHVLGTNLAIGLCSSEADVYQAASPAHWVGVVHSYNLLGGLTRYATPYRYTFGYDWRGVKRENGSNTTTGTPGSTTLLPCYPAAVAWYRGCLAARFVRSGVGLATWNFYIQSENTGGKDMTLADVWENADWPVYSYHTITNGAQVDEGGMGSLTIDEATYGALDYLNVYWNKTVPEFEIFGVTVKRLL